MAGLGWLAAAVVVVLAATMLAVRARGWWLTMAGAALTSQAVIVTSWADARTGTAANAVMLLAAGLGYLADGPHSLRAEYRRRASEALDGAPPAGTVTEQDVSRLPEPVAEYVRRSGAVGRPRVGSFHATVRGRIRGGPDAPWMTFTGEQVNTFGPRPRRLFFMDATMKGLPVDVLHAFDGEGATMRGRLCSLVPIVDASGPDMTRAETVTVFNDLCVMAPAALVDAPITWTSVGEHHACGTYSVGRQSVSAVLVFSGDHALVDFVSEDRLRASPDGRSFRRMPWSTPVGDYATFAGRRVATRGGAIWHAPPPEGRFRYLEFAIDDLRYDVRELPGRPSLPRRSRPRQAVPDAVRAPGVDRQALRPL